MEVNKYSCFSNGIMPKDKDRPPRAQQQPKAGVKVGANRDGDSKVGANRDGRDMDSRRGVLPRLVPQAQRRQQLERQQTHRDIKTGGMPPLVTDRHLHRGAHSRNQSLVKRRGS